MKHIVITGSTRGIGYGLARHFLLAGQRVTISGRKTSSVEEAVTELMAQTGNRNISGTACDVRNQEEIRALWDHASSVSPVNIWINNAGVGQPFVPFTELDPGTIGKLIETNISGLILASHFVLEKFLEQGSGALYTMEGFGSDGRVMANMSVYGTSKRAVHYFTRSLYKEFGHGGITIGSIRPGMVVTDLLTGQLERDSPHFQRSVRIFNILADTVDTVSPYIVKRVLKSRRKRVKINWLTGRKVMLRFLGSIFRKRKVDGVPVP